MFDAYTLSCLILLVFSAHARIIAPGGQWINLERLQAASTSESRIFQRQSEPSFPSFNFTQPLDHFTDTGFTWNQRYWVSTRHYQPGGPVIVLDSGESSGTERLPYLDTGIVDILANATGGLGIYGGERPSELEETEELCVLYHS